MRLTLAYPEMILGSVRDRMAAAEREKARRARRRARIRRAVRRVTAAGRGGAR